MGNAPKETLADMSLKIGGENRWNLIYASGNFVRNGDADGFDTCRKYQFKASRIMAYLRSSLPNLEKT